MACAESASPSLYIYGDYFFDLKTNQLNEPFKTITTQLPVQDATIRIIAAAAFAVMATIAALALTPWIWTVVAIGVVFAARTAYTNFLIEDPLLQAMYEMAGGKDKYEQLPVFIKDTSSQCLGLGTPAGISTKLHDALNKGVDWWSKVEKKTTILQGKFDDRKMLVIIVKRPYGDYYETTVLIEKIASRESEVIKYGYGEVIPQGVVYKTLPPSDTQP